MRWDTGTVAGAEAGSLERKRSAAGCVAEAANLVAVGFLGWTRTSSGVLGSIGSRTPASKLTWADWDMLSYSDVEYLPFM
jgi:hypothetical protein